MPGSNRNREVSGKPTMYSGRSAATHHYLHYHPFAVILRAGQLGRLVLGFALWLLVYSMATVRFLLRRDEEAVDLLKVRPRLDDRLPSWLPAESVVTDNDPAWQRHNGWWGLALPTRHGDFDLTAIAITPGSRPGVGLGRAHRRHQADPERRRPRDSGLLHDHGALYSQYSQCSLRTKRSEGERKGAIGSEPLLTIGIVAPNRSLSLPVVAPSRSSSLPIAP